MMAENLNFIDIFSNYVMPWGIDIFLALVILFVGRWLAKKLTNVAGKLMQRAEVDELLRAFLDRIIYGLALSVVLIAVLEQLGVNTTSALAIMGAAGLAVGLALKDSLSNVASGVMLIIFRPFDNGHYVEAGGVAGTVKEVGLFSTRLRTPDNRAVLVPNAEIYSGTITNYSANATRRIDLIFGIGYDDDIPTAKKLIEEILVRDQRVLNRPQWVIGVLELADNSVNLAVRPWVKTVDYWAVRFDLLERIKLTFDENGISIPYPQRDIHLHQVDTAAK